MILKLEPILIEKIWGGDKISKLFNGNTKKKYGEVWGISCYKDKTNTIKNGIFKGKTLNDLFESEKYLFGNYKGKLFPILVKIIDAQKDLSIQVHPNNKYAKKNEDSLGKSECWYVLDCKKDSNIIIGHNAKTKTDLVDSIYNHNYDNLLNHLKIKQGDYFYIEAGTIHAICKDTTILEVQQSSDITYRIFDYNRL